MEWRIWELGLVYFSLSSCCSRLIDCYSFSFCTILNLSLLPLRCYVFPYCTAYPFYRKNIVEFKENMQDLDFLTKSSLA